VFVGFIVLVATSAGIASADDEWPDRCGDQTPIVDSGDYSDTLSPEDRDYFKIDIPEGDYISARLSFKTSEEDGFLRFRPRGGSITAPDGSTLKQKEGPDPTIKRVTNSLLHMYEGELELRVYSESSDPFCFQLRTGDRSYSGEWKLSFTQEENPPPETGDTTQEVQELRDRLQKKNQAIEKLQTQLEAKNETLEDLRSDSENVVIEVTVEPAQYKSFVRGGSARISVESTAADLSEFEVRFNGESHQVSEEGSVTVPLAAAGTQKMVFSYGSVVERVNLSVKESTNGSAEDGWEDDASPPGQNVDQDGPVTQAGGNIIPVSGPGFGAPAAVFALLLLTLLLYSRR
jgi:hypothetical protein